MNRQNPILLHMLILLLGIMVVLAFVGCKTCKPIVEIRDSVRTVEIHKHDTALITKADSASIKLRLRCDSTNNVLIEQINAADGERLRLLYRLQQLLNGQSELELNCKEDSLIQVIQWQDSIIREKTNHTIIQERKVVPAYYKGCSIALWIFVALAIVYIVVRVLIRVYLHR